jgi:hypothetical protein
MPREREERNFSDQFTGASIFLLQHREEKNTAGRLRAAAHWMGEWKLKLCVFIFHESKLPSNFFLHFIDVVWREENVNEDEEKRRRRRKQNRKTVCAFFIILPTAFHSLPLFN